MKSKQKSWSSASTWPTFKGIMDYVFGWFLAGVYTATTLKDVLILKGGKGSTLMSRVSGQIAVATVLSSKA
jgi:hypothetical protein